MQALIRVWPWLKPYWRWALASAVGSAISVLINLLIPYQTARVIDRGIAEGDSAFVRETVLLMVLLILGGMAIAAFAGAMAVRASFYAITDLRQDLYEHAQSLSFGNLDRRPTGELLSRLTSDITKLQNGLTMGILIASRAPVVLFGALFAIIVLDSSLAFVALLMLPSIAIIFWIVVHKSGSLYDAVQGKLDRLNTVLQENIEGAALVKAFVRQRHEAQRFDEVADDLADHSIRVNQLVSTLMPALVAVASFAIAAVLWIGGGNVIDGSSSEGNLVAFISYIVMVSVPLVLFSFLQPLLTAAGASMARIDDVLADPPDVAELADPTRFRHPMGACDVLFHNVWLAYASSSPHEAKRFALQGINLHIPAGQTVAIMGATGSGKSSLIHLIPRFYDATAGSVFVGGVDVREQSKARLRSLVGIALQTPRLFSGTVAENLRMGRPGASDGQLASAAMTAQAHGFIRNMPSGYESQLAEGGANLSGGQRQRLAIARTILADPEILILDDSTSSVDLETELRMHDAFAAFFDRTVIVVAQRISTALAADRIVLLDAGQISAVGSHVELMMSSGIYREIYASQLGQLVL